MTETGTIEIPMTDSEIIRRLFAPIRQEHEDRLKANKAKIRSNFKLMKLLKSHGFAVPNMDRWNCLRLTIDIDRDRIAELRGVLGGGDNRPVATGYKELRDADPSDRHCWIYLKSAKYPGTQFRYLVCIPEKGKCNIETTTVTNTYRRLVCKQG